jgi:hypothetical protein
VPGVGGCVLEVHDSGPGQEMARVTVWEPGRRLVLVDERITEIAVTFVAVDSARSSAANCGRR